MTRAQTWVVTVTGAVALTIAVAAARPASPKSGVHLTKPGEGGPASPKPGVHLTPPGEGGQTPDNPLTLPPGATRIVNFVKSGVKVAMCAEVSGETAPRSGADAPRAQTYVFVDDGKRISKVVVAPGGCDPAWSPDGARLAIVNPDGLWVFTDNGAKGSRVVDTNMPAFGPRTISGRIRFSKPQWSPDGAMVAFVAGNGQISWVEVADATTGKWIFKSPGEASAFSWGPDSKSLVIGGKTVPIK